MAPREWLPLYLESERGTVLRDVPQRIAPLHLDPKWEVMLRGDVLKGMALLYPDLKWVMMLGRDVPRGVVPLDLKWALMLRGDVFMGMVPLYLDPKWGLMLKRGQCSEEVLPRGWHWCIQT